MPQTKMDWACDIARKAMLTYSNILALAVACDQRTQSDSCKYTKEELSVSNDELNCCSVTF